MAKERLGSSDCKLASVMDGKGAWEDVLVIRKSEHFGNGILRI